MISRPSNSVRSEQMFAQRKSRSDVAEGVGLEPTSPCGRRFSKAAQLAPHYFRSSSTAPRAYEHDCRTSRFRLVHTVDPSRGMSPECQFGWQGTSYNNALTPERPLLDAKPAVDRRPSGEVVAGLSIVGRIRTLHRIRDGQTPTDRFRADGPL